MIDWTPVGVIGIVAALGLLSGATLGYFTASSDLKRERAKAWDRGSADALNAVKRIWLPPTTVVIQVRNPYESALAPEPPHHDFRLPLEPVLDFRPPVLFDQDAIEIRGD